MPQVKLSPPRRRSHRVDALSTRDVYWIVVKEGQKPIIAYACEMTVWACYQASRLTDP